MYEVLDKDTIKSEILPHLSVAKRGCVSNKVTWRKSSQPLFCKLKASFLRHKMRKT